MTEKERYDRKTRIIINEFYENARDKRLIIVTHLDEEYDKTPEYNKVVFRELTTSKTDWMYVDFFHNVYRRINYEKAESQ